MMMILEVDESVLFATMNESLQNKITSLNGQFVEAMLIGTQAVNGRKLIFISVDATPEQVELLTNSDAFDDEGNQIAFDLGWQVLAVENEVVDQSLLLPYFAPVPVFEFDDDGEYVQTGTQPVTDLTGKLQVWAGKSWIY